MNIFRQWRRWIRPLVVFFYIVILLIAFPFIIIEFQENKVRINYQAWFIGGFFVVLAVPISLWGILEHFIHYTQPFLQRHIIRIIWMVPIYAVNAWLALRFYKSALYLDTLRECYEAYVIYNFLAYLLQFLWTEYPELDEHLAEKPDVKHPFPFCYCQKWKNGRQALSWCKHGVLQYVVVRPIMAILEFIFQITATYGEGEFSYKSGWLYTTIINNCSQIWAMYCLVMFYTATKEELAPIKPIPKFLCIKAVVFFSFWQSVLISILVYFKIIRDYENLFSQDQLASGLQDLLICIEMFFAALAHYYAFSHKPYVDYAQGHQNWMQSLKQMFDISDVRDDVVNHVRIVGATATEAVTRPLRKTPTGTETEKSPLLSQTSNASDSIDFGTTSGGEDSDYGGLIAATPPVVLTNSDFHSSVESSHSAAIVNRMLYSDQSDQDVSSDVYVDTPHQGQVTRRRTQGSPNANNHHTRNSYEPAACSQNVRPKELIDFTSDDNFDSTNVSHEQRKKPEDAQSTHTIDSLASDALYQRRSLTASMNNYAQFSEASVNSSRSNSPPAKV